MAENDSGRMAPGVTGLVLVLLLTFPSISSTLIHIGQSKSNPKPKIYEDKDGAATTQSMAKFSAKVPKIFHVLSTISGLSVSIALAILATVDSPRGIFADVWLNAAQWFLLLVQALAIATVRNTAKAYTLGVFSLISCILLLVVLLFQGMLLAEDSGPSSSFCIVGLRIAQLALVISAGLAGVSIPRRPDVFNEGAIVDGMSTVSVLERYTFSWVRHLLVLAQKTKRLNQNDLPRMDHYTRARDLSEAWGQEQHASRLWIEVFLAHRAKFFTQWFLTLLQAFGSFAPQFVIYHILQILERRVVGQAIGSEAWVWVLMLTLATIGAAWNDAWLFWISWSGLAIPIRSQLSSLIFQKAMRRKDVKGTQKHTKQQSSEDNTPCDIGARDSPKIDSDENDPKGKQSTINLIGVDTKRVSDFCSVNNNFQGCICKLTISLLFLLNILGWKVLVCGLLVMSFILPMNIFFSRRYSAAQGRLMKVRDVKMGVVTEALQGIRQIKFSALESNWHAKIGKVRAKELAEQWSVYLSDTALLFCWITGPVALAATSLSVYAWLYGELSPSIAFTSIGVFGGLELQLAIIPELTTDLIDAWVSIERIEKYLNAPEISKNTNDALNVSFENASIAWPSDEEEEQGDERYVLQNIDVSFPEKELSVVSGKTGSGKSLLLAAILGEVDLLSGKVNVPRPPPTEERHDHLATKDNWIIPSSIAFVAQTPWIENASIKDNILFGLPFDECRYQKVIHACALTKDLEMLADGENTEIGANGINLSGGQRWRVTFARALYSRAGILVLDDIFSALDANVGRFTFEEGLTGELGIGRTRILVTHHVALCKSKAKYIVELGHGTVEKYGFTQDLASDGTLQEIVNREETEHEIQEDQESTAVDSEQSVDGEITTQLKKVDSKKVTPKKFVEDEAREQGAVKAAVYLNYMKSSGGWPFWSVALLSYAILQGFVIGRSWWLRLWTSDTTTEQHPSTKHSFTYSFQVNTFMYAGAPSLNSTTPIHRTEDIGYYLAIYIALSVVSIFLGTFRYWWIYTGSIRASRRLFDKLSFTILRTPLRWMDTVPLGRILNRFTADFTVVDSKLSMDIGFGANNLFRLAGIIIAGILVSPWIIILSLVLLGLCLRIALQFLPGAREVKRLESNAKSPIFEQFGSALTGVGTIRAFDKCDVYISRMFSKIDDHTTSHWHLWAFNRWMGWRMALIGGFFATFICVFILLMGGIDAALAGFALSFALEYGQVVAWTIRHYTNLELDMNAAERIMEYSDLPTEPLDGADPPAAWPSEGRLEVDGLVVGYAPNLPPVLKNLTFAIEPNERIGVVGRTGAGKSSLTLALFRFLEAREGSVYIDGLDISTIKLQALRSRLAIIPQDPVLFSGTVRSNLDAFDEHSDSELRDALIRVHLASSSDFDTSSGSPHSGLSAPTAVTRGRNTFPSLNSAIAEGGLNLSQGQRQLLCLARAIVSRPKIMVLDEATSAVDMATDSLIQRSIREEFKDSTLVVIAHRLSTIADFDKILVMAEGKQVEFGTPRELWGNKSGVFRAMVGESGEKDRLEAILTGDNSQTE